MFFARGWVAAVAFRSWGLRIPNSLEGISSGIGLIIISFSAAFNSYIDPKKP